MTTAAPFPTEELHIDRIKPYWRNPRRISDDSVNAVAESIKEFGYQQPIVVDKDHTIIIGHTRYTAMRRLGVEQVTVMVADLPQDKVKQLRVIDNRAGEYTSWDFDALADELLGLDDALMATLFPDVDVTDMDDGPPPGLPRETDTDADDEAEFVCPSCFHSFEVKITRDAVLSGRLVARKEDAA